MRFQDIVGQQTACTQLRQAYRHQRLSHAYIFDGPSGVGKMATAQALAALLLCQAPQDADACGCCNSCRQLQSGTHPDCHLVVPDGKSIKIKQIRELRNSLSSMATYGGYTVVLIDDADTLGIEAANALLKTIEEPQGPTCFILITSHADRLPDTIRSRAQLLRFKPLGDANILRLLGEDSPEARRSAELAFGSLARAQALLHDPEQRDGLSQRIDKIRALLSHLISTHDGALLRYCDSFTGNREAVNEQVLLIRHHYRAQLKTALKEGSDLGPTVALLHCTNTALQRLQTNTEPSFILGALLIEMAHTLRQ